MGEYGWAVLEERASEKGQTAPGDRRKTPSLPKYTIIRIRGNQTVIYPLLKVSGERFRATKW